MTYPFLMNQVWKNHIASPWGKPLGTETAATSHVTRGFTEAKSSRRQEGLFLSKASVASWAEKTCLVDQDGSTYTLLEHRMCAVMLCCTSCPVCVSGCVCGWLRCLLCLLLRLLWHWFFLMFNYLLFTTPDWSSVNLLPAGDQFLSDLLIHTKQLVTSEGISCHLCGTDIN